MDIENIHTVVMPSLPPAPAPAQEAPREHASDQSDIENISTVVTPSLLPILSLSAQGTPKVAPGDEGTASEPAIVGTRQKEVIIPRYPVTPPASPTVSLGKRQHSRLRQTTISTFAVKVPGKSPSPELAELLEHRERLAFLETMELQALGALLTEQKTVKLDAVATKTTTEKPGAAAATKPATEKSDAAAAATKPAAEKSAQVATKRHRRLRRVPGLLQISMVECGAACLAMLLSYYGRKTTVSEVREQCGIGRDGLSALSLVKSARKYGMRVRAVTLEENDFKLVTLPAVVHWEFNHFIVVERWSPKFVDVVDPAVGRRRMTAKEFDDGFTGVVIMMEPGEQFSRENKISKLSLTTYAKSYMRQAPAALVQIIGASLLLQLLGLVFPVLSIIIINNLIPMKMSNALQILGIGVIMLVLSQTIIKQLRAMILLYLQARVDTNLMFSFLEHLLSLPQHFFLQRSTGDIISRVSSNTVIRDTISNQLFSTLLDGIFVLAYFFILLSQSLSFTLVVVVIGGLQAVLLLTTGKHLTELNRRELAASGKSQGYLTETLAGIRTLKSAGAEYRALERWTNFFFDQMNISVRRVYVSSFIDNIMSTLGTFAPLILLWLGTQQVINGKMDLGTMLALNALGSSLLGPISSLVSSTRQIQLVQSHMERLADVIEADAEQDIQSVSQPPQLTGRIRLENVFFQYDPQSPLVLRDISVDILPRQKVAIVGKTGSGKSTLGSLLLGLYTPTKGSIFYDDISLQKLNYQAVRSQFGVVMQEATIFSGPIRENITLNDPGMTMEQVIKAAQLADIHNEIMKLPMEYETVMSEGGNSFSGGQRQRLAIARAIANSPVILLLDEATSSLDVVTERVVEQNISQLPCTQIIIAHRLSTIRNADVILVLHEGQVVERGRHDDLLRSNGYYARLIQSQIASGELVSK